MSPFGRFQEPTGGPSLVYVPRNERGSVTNVLAYSRVRLPTELHASVDAFSYAEGYRVSGEERTATFDDTNLLEATMICGPGESCLVEGVGLHMPPWWQRKETLDVHARTSMELNVYGQRYVCGSADLCGLRLADPSAVVRDGLRVLRFMPFPEPIVLREEVPVTVRLRCEKRTEVDTPHPVVVVLVGLQGEQKR